MLTEQEKSELRKKTQKTMKGKKAFRKEIESRLSPADAEKIWREAHSRLFKMYAEHTDLPKGVRAHTDRSIFPAAAIYLAMKELDPEMAFDVMRKIMTDQSESAGKSIGKCCRIPGFKRFFLNMWDTMSHKMFGETAGFQNVFYPKEEKTFRMDITQCPYHTYLTEQGCPELNILFCENDIHAYGNLPGLKFTRTKTIGAGDELCDFKMELVK